MRLRNIRGSKDVIASCPFVVQEPESCRGRWVEVFGNENPIHIEVGMGKGRFLMDMAVLHPEINYIGIEMYDSVLLRAVQKREKLETELKNLFFIRMDARQLPEVFAEGEVDRIYLNFSDPWPKDRHAKRRLTSHEFLARYEKILKKDGTLEFKTDNKDLFDFSLEEMKNAESKMNKAIASLEGDLASIRAGRANPAILDKVTVEYYGVQTPLAQVGTISVPEARTIIVQPWDVSVLKEVEKAILASDIGINPNNDGKVIRLNFPPLTEERRKELNKTVSKRGEEAKVAVRNIRRDSIEQFKKQKKANEITEDDLKDLEDQIQKMTDKFVKKIDGIIADKEKEIMEV